MSILNNTASNTTDNVPASITAATNCSKRANRRKVTSKVKFLQINLNRSPAALTELRVRTANCVSPCIVLIQEPPTSADGKPKGFGCTRHRKLYYAPPVGRCRTCVFIINLDNAWLAPNLSDDDCTTVLVCHDSLYFTCSSLYFDIKNDILRNPLGKLVENCKGGLICGIDSNAHSETWGCSEGNSRGRKLEEAIASLNLVTLNNGAQPTFVTQTRQTIIDITVANNIALQKITNWKVDPSPSLSDHKYIAFDFAFKNRHPTPRFNPRTLDVDLFKKTVESYLDSIPAVDWSTREGLEILAEDFENGLWRAIEVSCTRFSGQSKDNNSWWDKELADLRKVVRRLHKKKDRSTNDRQLFYDSRLKYRLKIEEKRKLSWEECCTNLNEMGSISRMVRHLREGAGHEIGLVTNNQGDPPDNPQQSIRNLCDRHFPDNVPLGNSPKIFNPKFCRNVTCRSEIPNVTPVPEQEGMREALAPCWVQKAFKSFKPYKAPGYDGISPVFLQNLP